MCYSPVKVSKYGTDIVVPCGKCLSCQLDKDKIWSLRVASEASQHRYVYQCTLTYDNNHVPFTCVDELPPRYRNGKFPFLRNFPIPRCIGLLDKTDAQKFLKRFRINLLRLINSQINYENKQNYYKNGERNKFSYRTSKEVNIRYYLVGEYGYNFARPHYHVIFFYDDEKIMQFIQASILKSWKMCPAYRTARYCGLVKSTDTSYFANYLNVHNDLSGYYQTKEVRQFRLASKAPAIGYYKDEEEKVLQSFLDGTFQLSRYSTKTRELDYYEFPSYYLYKYFPKCKGYSSLSPGERYVVYKYAKFSYPGECSISIPPSVKSLLSDFGRKDKSDSFSHYLLVSESKRSAELISLREEIIDDICCHPISIRASKIADEICKKYGLSLSDYLLRLDELYHHRSMLQLSKWYQSLELYARNGFRRIDNIYTRSIYDLPKEIASYDWRTLYETKKLLTRLHLDFDCIYHHYDNVYVNSYDSRKLCSDTILQVQKDNDNSLFYKKKCRKAHHSIKSYMTMSDSV